MLETALHQAVQIVAQGPHRRADRHVVVVQDHQHIEVAGPSVVHALIRHASAERPIANHGHHFTWLLLQARAHGHAQRGRDAGRRVGGAKGIVRALFSTWKPAQAIFLSQGVHAIAPTGQDFVAIGLMPHIPDDAVMGGVVDVVQRHRQLHRAQVGAQMTAGLGHAVQQLLAQRRRDLGQSLRRQPTQGAGIGQLVKHGHVAALGGDGTPI